jgi:phosphatidylethanolamine/phosphatidyl-N-methylethanolamine N-methyltransferase
MADGVLLFREFLRAPARVATVTASSDALVTAVATGWPDTAEPVVVELGAGSGRVTDALQRRLRGRGRHLAIEISPVLADRLAARHPDVTVVCADAGDLHTVLREHDVERVDVVSSLLPWAAYAAAPIPAIAAAVLAPAGTFLQVALSMTQWMPPARRQRHELREAFGEVTVGPTVWRNLPPARVLVARAPRPR